MGISLKKSEAVSLVKQSQARLDRIALGVGWDVASEPQRKGFLNALFGTGGQPDSIDLDASCIVFNGAGKLIDTVWFRQLESTDGAIQHSGDNLTGEGEGDDETIFIDLGRLSPSAETLVLTVTSFRGQTFASVANAFGRVVDEGTGNELARFDISDSGAHTGLILATLKRDAGSWTFKAIGERTSGRTVQELAPTAARFI